MLFESLVCLTEDLLYEYVCVCIGCLIAGNVDTLTKKLVTNHIE